MRREASLLDRGTPSLGLGLRNALFVIAVGLTGVGTASATPFVYDWSTATGGGALVDSNGPAAGGANDGWTWAAGVGDGSGDTVESTGQPDGFFSGNYMASVDTEPGNGDTIYRRDNDGTFSFAIPSNATTITLSAITRHSAELASSTDLGRVGIVSSTSTVFSIGNGASGWLYRDFGDTNSMAANGTGPAELDGMMRTWRITASVDLTPVGTEKRIDFLVENLTDGGSELIFEDEPLELSTFDDPSTWDALFIRVNGIDAPAYIDAITVAFTPEPSTFLLATLGLGGLTASRRRRS